VRQLADHLGFARVSSISDLEHGRVRLHVYQLLRLAEPFEAPMQALLDSVGAEMAGKSEEVAVKDQKWKEYAK
jgi:hypothetical protein